MERERNFAGQQLERAEETLQLFTSSLGAGREDGAKRETTVLELLEAIAARLEIEPIGDPRIEGEIRYILAESLTNLAEMPAAHEQARRAAAVLEPLGAEARSNWLRAAALEVHLAARTGARPAEVLAGVAELEPWTGEVVNLFHRIDVLVHLYFASWRVAAPEAAERHAREAIRLAESVERPDEVERALTKRARLVSYLAGSLVEQGRLGDAIDLMRSELPGIESRYGRDSFEYVQGLSALCEAEDALEQPDHESILERLGELLEIVPRVEKVPDQATLDINEFAARCQAALGRPEEAFAFYRAAIEYGERVHGGQHPAMAAVKGRMATYAWRVEDPDVCLPLMIEARDDLLQAHGGPTGLSMGLSSRIQDVYRTLGRAEDYERELAVAESTVAAVWPANHVGHYGPAINRAKLVWRQGDVDAARERYDALLTGLMACEQPSQEAIAAELTSLTGDFSNLNLDQDLVERVERRIEELTALGE